MGTFWRLLGFLRPYRRGVIFSAGLAALAMGATVLLPYLIGQAIDETKAGASDKVNPNALADHKGFLTFLGVLIVITAMLRLALTVTRRLVAGRVSLGVEVDLRNRLYSHLQSLELGFFDRQQTGQLMSRATVDLQSVRFFLGYGLIFIMQSALTILLGATAMFLVDPGLAAIALAPVPFVVVIAARYGRRARPAQQEVQQRIAELTADAEENVSGVRVIKAFAREQVQLQRFRRSVTRVFEQAMIATRLQAFYTPFIGFLPNLGLAAILLFGGLQVIHGSLSIGDFSAFYTYLLMLISPMRTLGVALGMAQRATASGRRIFEILDRKPQMPVPEDAPPLPAGAGRVEFRDVTLSYGAHAAFDPQRNGASLRAAQPALRDVSLTVAAGTTVAIVGATASGKTSLVSLIPRLYDATSGAVLVDGADVRSVGPGSLRRAVALVTDDPFLFSATVDENIAYVRPEATREEVVAAAQRAQAHAFVTELPDGYDTLIGERGLTVSGGQRQRLAIARAILADPRILILDDATSSVDASTEQEIKTALREVMSGRTTFVIAHRLSTIALADEIVVLEAGRITAEGGHEELLERSPLYREIVEKGLPDQVFLNRNPAEAVGL
jgi:ABC-type multidrug transport system fused ATPase/permease subunit